MNFVSIISEFTRGKDMYRILMNTECQRVVLQGQVVDIGSSVALASYHRHFIKDASVKIECLDLNFVETLVDKKQINLETDALPYTNATVDTALLFNVLEHLYNYSLVLSEVKRILKPGGRLIGAVPFLVNYHPDPHDYWRYTAETLTLIFREAGFEKISVKPFGIGPFAVAFSVVEPILPRFLKIGFFPLVIGLDWLTRHFNSRFEKEKFPLGYFFVVNN